MELFDTHAHVNDEAYDQDREAMLAACFEAGVQYIVCPGVDIETSKSAIAMAAKYPQIYAAVGIHPEEGAPKNESDWDLLDELASQSKVVAIGEIGLDYYNDENCDHDTQKELFIRQLALARKHDLPILIHDREAHGDLMDILCKEGKDNYGILHCYSGSWEMAKELIKHNFYISFAGPVAFKNSKTVKAVAKEVPMDRLLIETDSPYLTPPPFRGKRNDPSKTQYIAEEIGRLKGMEAEEVAKTALENAKRLFKIQ